MKKSNHFEDLGTDNIEMDVKEIGWDGVNFIYFPHGKDK
jgi:hypothetical protein